MIEEIQHEKRERRLKELAAGGVLALVLIGAAITFYGLPELPMNTDENREFDKQITITRSIQPYETSIRKNETVKITNKRENSIKLRFGTNNIEANPEIGVNESYYFSPNKYGNLPKVNYFHTNNGDTGEILVK